MGVVFAEQKKKEKKTNNWPPFWGPAFVEQKKEEQRKNPQMGAVLIKQKQKKTNQPPKW